MVKRIPVLWFVEHVAREMDVACAVKSISKSFFNLDITIRHIYHHTNQVFRDFHPRVIVLPFFYRASGVAIKEYTEMWPHAAYLNLAWEEIFYKAQNKMKAPSDAFTREKVIHHAWGNFYRQFLIEHLVAPRNIFVNGNPAYQLYKLPYKNYYKSRVLLAEENGLDAQARWVFVPENYRWAFVSDNKIRTFVSQGGDLKELLEMREFCKQSLEALLKWCNMATDNGGLEIIFRPRPSTSAAQMQSFFQNVVKHPAVRLHFIKADSVRDWILASDLVISSYSTSLIEAAIAGKPAYMSEPIPIPPSIYCDWYAYVPRLHTAEEFQAACLADVRADESALASWACREMLSRGDPIKGLATFLLSLVRQEDENDKGRFWQLQATLRSGRKRAKWRAKHIEQRMKTVLHSLHRKGTVSNHSLSQTGFSGHAGSSGSGATPRDRRKTSYFKLLKGKTYSDPLAHEGDQFTESEVQTRVELWGDTMALRVRSHDINKRATHSIRTKRNY